MSRQQRRARERAEKKARRRSTSLAGTLATIGALMAAAPAAATSFTVTNLSDAGTGSLRDAVAQANASAGTDNIVFQSGLSGTLTLTTGSILITDAVTISGTGATVSISGNNSSGIFDIENMALTPPINVHIDHLTLTQGSAMYGGAIRDKDENLVLDNVTISGSTAVAGGGVAFYGNNGAALTITQSTITGNTSYYGGGVAIQAASGPITLTGVQLTNNHAELVGGGLSATLKANASVTVTGSTISGNGAGVPAGSLALGGGLAFDGRNAAGAATPVTISDSTISGNTAMANNAGFGGGIYFIYVVGASIAQSTISGNQSDDGGAIDIEDSGTAASPLRIQNSTIVNNVVSYGGGGIYACANSYSSIENTTITGNSAAHAGGGIDFVNATVSDVSNSIIANNTSPTGSDINTEAGTNVTINYTLIKTPGAAVFGGGTGNITGVDPGLGPLAAFPGSPTSVERPACGSIVINRGDPAFVGPPLQDQRHQPRIAGSRVDIGAVEFQPSTIQFAVAAANVNENAGAITLTASRTGLDGAVSVNYATADGTAKGTTSGIGTPDYVPTSGTLNWADLDAANKTFSVSIVNDAVFEGNENFTATLSSPSCGVALGAPATETVTIIDGQTQPTLSINNVSQLEGNSGTTNMVFTVTLSGQSAQTVTVNYATANGTATAGSDYSATSGTLTFNPGVTSLPISVSIVGDTVFEADETFTVTLSTASNATISNATGTGTIRNDDAAIADLSITKTASAPPFFTNQTLTYTLTVSNSGPNTATTVTVTDVLPAGTIFVSATPTQGSCSGTLTVTCNLGTLNNAASATVSLQVRRINPGTFSNTATVSAPQTDNNPANNSSSVSVNVQPATDIPTLSEKMLMLLAAMFAAIGAWFAGKKS